MENFAAAKPLPGDRGTKIAAGQADDGIGIDIGVDDVLAGDDNPRPYPGQSQFGKAQRENDVVVPDRCGVHETDIGKRQAIGAVDDQRDVIRAGNIVQLCYLAVGQHVPGGVRGARDTERPYTLVDVQTGKIHPVFEDMVVQDIDAGPCGAEERLAETQVGVSQVFGRDGQVNGAPCTAGHVAGKHVVEHEKRRLAAVRNRDIASRQIPAILRAKEARHLLAKVEIALW